MWQSRESSAPGDEVFACSAVGGEGHVLRELAEDSLHHGHVLQVLVRLEQRIAWQATSDVRRLLYLLQCFPQATAVQGRKMCN